MLHTTLLTVLGSFDAGRNFAHPGHPRYVFPFLLLSDGGLVGMII